MRTNIKNQRGVSLVEVILALSVMTVVASSALWYMGEEFKKDSAKLYGQQIARYITATRAALVNEGPSYVGQGPTFISGTDWLHSSDVCGGTALAGQPYLPCGFTGQMKSGDNLTGVANGAMTIGSNGASPPTISGVSIFHGVRVPNASGAAVDRPDLTAIAVAAAIKYDGYDAASKYSGGTTAYLTSGTYLDPASNTIKNVPANRIVAIATASAGADMFLRVDGTNQMKAALNMGSQDINSAKNYNGNGEITNKGNVTNTGSISAIATAADLNSGNIKGETLQVVKQSASGTSCDILGQLSRDSKGKLVSCLDSIWVSKEDCPLLNTGYDVNNLGTEDGTAACYTGENLKNAPGLGIFIYEIRRAKGPKNTYLIQRATALNGALANATYQRNFQDSAWWSTWARAGGGGEEMGTYKILNDGTCDVASTYTSACSCPIGSLAQLWSRDKLSYTYQCVSLLPK